MPGDSLQTIVQSGNIFRVQRATWAAGEVLKAANNKRSAAEATLAEFSRSLGNQLRSEQAGTDYNNAISQIADQMDTRQGVKLNISLQANAKLGAIQAAAGAAGVGGSSVELLSTLTKLQRNTAQQENQTQTDRFSTSASRLAGTRAATGLAALDFAPNLATFDYTRSIKPSQMHGKVGAIIGIALASIFGGASAGKAAADGTVAAWQGQNGNFEAANGLAGEAANGWMQAYKDYQSRGGRSWISSVMNPDGTNNSPTKGDYTFNSYTGNDEVQWPGSGGGSGFNLATAGDGAQSTGDDNSGITWSGFGGGDFGM